MEKEILTVHNLKKYFQTPQGVVKAVDGVNFSIERGQTLGLVGESGSGKSTVAYTIMGLYKQSSGEVLFEGSRLQTSVRKRPITLRKKLQIVFQDPSSSLNPKRNIKQILELPLKVHGITNKDKLETKILELLSKVELPNEYIDRYPGALGGGEKQAVAIARAIATEPSFVVLDEPTSALDVSAQAKIIRMLMRFQKTDNLSYLFITHDLSLMRNVAAKVAIMYLGKINEVADTSEFFQNPLHPYTKMLLSSIPVITDEEEDLKPKKIFSTGEIPSPINVPSGCAFHPRCQESMEICLKIDPVMREIEPGHCVRCHIYSISK